jgi:predicted nucleic-acid-binding protein
MKSDIDAEQNRIAADLFRNAVEIVIPTHVLCELAWVLASRYKLSQNQIQQAIATLLSIKKVRVKEDETQAGLDMMADGGDFADGVNEFVGRQMQKSSVFVSFDRKAVKIFTARGISAMVPE